ncbi:hypothetical protein M4A92_15790 [Caldibacillus thermoamylovorans]|jgi:hypothetical protein|uniref:hypothetical protein n=1 Tax=Caldibacillus thermoamylovorans TaxID=35841 RepID=UPI0020425E2C|nr:hypothetical protein [Caldibacillus thermoamylovorans]MCM3800057.1 hypothetical protein [Caldibacillus thermoamylovorans]
MKKLKIFKENGEFVIERFNEFNHSEKRYFITEEGLKEGLDAYLHVMEEYEIEASEDVWALVINHLGKKGNDG